MSATIDLNATEGPSLKTQVTERAKWFGKFAWRTYPEQLQAAGVSWKVYSTPDGKYGDDVLPYFKAYQESPQLAANALAPTFPADFLAAYEAAGGAKVSQAALHFWEVVGNLRWAVGCIAQANRHLSGQAASVELASLGRRTGEMDPEECANGHAHCQHLLIGGSENIPVADGRPDLGRWQRIFLLELDRARDRQLVVQVFGA